MTGIEQTVKRRHPLAECENCPLYGKPCAPSQKAPQPVAAIVSRSPGYTDGLNGKPFSGASGKVLDHLLKMNGVRRDQVLVTNTVLCSPDKGKVPPEAIKACAPRLRAELQDVDLVIACGSEAVNELIGRGAIDRYRGQRIRRGKRTLVAANNPALVLRDDATFPNLRRDFQRAFHPLPPPTFPTVEVIEDAKTARELIDYLRSYQSGVIAADIESRGGLTHEATLISVQFTIDGRAAFVLGERGGLFTDEHFLLDCLQPFLESRDYNFVWHGGKFDTKIFRHSYGIKARVDEDTMLLSYALDERSGTDERIGVHGLDYLLMDTFGWPHYASPAVEKAKKTGVVEDYDEFYTYAGMDVGGTYQLYQHQLEKIELQPEVHKMYHHMLIRGNELLTNMELQGMIYDVERASDVYEFEVEPEMRKLTQDMRNYVDSQILNPRSPIQMSAYFYDKWGIKHEMQDRPDKKRSVDDSARKEILEGRFSFRGSQVPERVGNTVHMVDAPDATERREFIQSFVKMYDRYQELQKQASTYLIKMIERAEPVTDHRVHTQLNLHGTNSGRLSSSKPNLQNITRTKPGLPDIRRLFSATPGNMIVQADYSQAELRCIAQMSGDPLLMKIYKDDLDLHNETATRFYGPAYTSEQRGKAKNMNFGVFYRQSAQTFQEKHGIPEREGQKFIDWIWSTYLGVKAWEEDIEKQVRKPGYLVSAFGRRRRFYLLTKENIQAAFREGINFYPQATASDLTLASAIRIYDNVDTKKAALVLTVHDSILADVVESYIDEYRGICRQIMESCANDELGWTLPFKCDIGVGPTWGEAK
jgi:uracil-DNA glycosylase family 4